MFVLNVVALFNKNGYSLLIMKVNGRFYWALLFVLVLGLGACSSGSTSSFDVDKEIAYCELQARKSLTDFPEDTLIPRIIEKGQSTWDYAGVEDWTSGFWPGALWYLYEASGDERWEKEARKFTSYLEPLAYGEPLDHDLGFQIFCSFGNAYRLTGDAAYKPVIISTAEKLAKLYNPTVGTILSWPGLGHLWFYHELS